MVTPPLSKRQVGDLSTAHAAFWRRYISARGSRTDTETFPRKAFTMEILKKTEGIQVGHLLLDDEF